MDDLDALHREITKVLLKAVKSDEPNAAMLNVAIKFLKDNNVTTSVKHNPDMQALAQAVPFSEPDEYGLQ